MIVCVQFTLVRQCHRVTTGGCLIQPFLCFYSLFIKSLTSATDSRPTGILKTMSESISSPRSSYPISLFQGANTGSLHPHHINSLDSCLSCAKLLKTCRTCDVSAGGVTLQPVCRRCVFQWRGGRPRAFLISWKATQNQDWTGGLWSRGRCSGAPQRRRSSSLGGDALVTRSSMFSQHCHQFHWFQMS